MQFKHVTVLLRRFFLQCFMQDLLTSFSLKRFLHVCFYICFYIFDYEWFIIDQNCGGNFVIVRGLMTKHPLETNLRIIIFCFVLNTCMFRTEAMHSLVLVLLWTCGCNHSNRGAQAPMKYTAALNKEKISCIIGQCFFVFWLWLPQHCPETNVLFVFMMPHFSFIFMLTVYYDVYQSWQSIYYY